jgi:hypothetical protein
MYESIISLRGLTRIFEGELVPSLTREGRINHYRQLGFRHVSKDVMERNGYSLNFDTLSCPDNREVYKSIWVFNDGRKLRQQFFPRHWTRADVLAAIAEAYETREPKKWGMPGKFFQGRTRDGLRIILELDENNQVLDAIPRTSNTNHERLARWRVEHGFSRVGRYFCRVCGKLKRGHELCHHMKASSRLYRRARRCVRKMYYGLGRWVVGPDFGRREV